MIKYIKSTVFNVDVQTIVNTVNCVGVMGSGLALEFKLRFPEMYEDYSLRCKRKEVKIGKPYLYRGYTQPLILNFPTKNHWKYPSKLIWIEEGLKYFRDNYEKGGIQSVAFPRLGTSRGKLDWKLIKPLMEKYLEKLDIDVYICLDEENKASGIEGQMVVMINNLIDRNWVSTLKIGINIETKIYTKLPISRFHELASTKGVDKKSYEIIFRYFYNKVIRSDCDTKDDNYDNRKFDAYKAVQLKLTEE